MLKFMLESLDGLSPEIAGLYTEKNGKFYLGVEGAVGDGDVAGLKTALEKERSARKAAEGKFSGVDPDEYARLKTEAEKAEADKLAKAGEWDKIKAKLVESHEAEKAEWTGKLSSLEAELNNGLIQREFLSSGSKHKAINPGAVAKFLSDSVKVEIVDGKRVARVYDGNGEARVNAKGEYMTIDDAVAEAKGGDLAFAFEGGKPGGGSGPDSGKNNPNTPKGGSAIDSAASAVAGIFSRE
jgi:hypothetical protein